MLSTTSSTPDPTPDPAPVPASAPTAARPARRRLLSVTAVLVGLVATVVVPVGLAAAAPETVTPGSAIEAFAPYQGQTQCEAVARPGVTAFRDLVLATYPSTGDSGIVRSCSVGGVSEHKEGRAWDWRVNTANVSDVEAVEDLFDWLLAEDEHGNVAAMMRRLGVMYVIWDSRIWKSYQADRGWQRYSGAIPHTDHVHFSYSWAGALKRTSYWSGQVSGTVASPIVVTCPTASPSPSASATAGGASGTGTGTASGTASSTATATASPSASIRPCASAAPRPTASASPVSSPTGSASATPTVTPTVSPTPSPSPTTTLELDVDAGAQRRAVVGSMPGPWRRR